MTKNKIKEVLVLGLPNAGKSTLVNTLSKRKTSIIYLIYYGNSQNLILIEVYPQKLKI